MNFRKNRVIYFKIFSILNLRHHHQKQIPISNSDHFQRPNMYFCTPPPTTTTMTPSPAPPPSHRRRQRSQEVTSNSEKSTPSPYHNGRAGMCRVTGNRRRGGTTLTKSHGRLQHIWDYSTTIGPSFPENEEHRVRWGGKGGLREYLSNEKTSNGGGT